MFWAGCARGVVSVDSSPGVRGVGRFAFSRVRFGLAGLRVVRFGSSGARGVNRAVPCVRGRARAQATTTSLASALAAWRRQSHRHRCLLVLLRASSAA